MDNVNGLIEVQYSGGRSMVTRLFSSFPIRFMTSSMSAEVPHIFFLGFGGGILAGDESRVNISMKESSVMCLRTQGTTKIFKSKSDEIECGCKQNLVVELAKLSFFVYLPDPISGFRDSIYEQNQQFSLIGSASIVVVDWYTCGRGKTRDEFWAQKVIKSCNRVTIDNQIVIHDNLNLFTCEISGSIAEKVGEMDVFGSVILVLNYLVFLNIDFDIPICVTNY